MPQRLPIATNIKTLRIKTKNVFFHSNFMEMNTSSVHPITHVKVALGVVHNTMLLQILGGAYVLKHVLTKKVWTFLLDFTLKT